MPNSITPAPTHWSKDFVEHLRTVHFTLIALSVGLIVLASFPSRTEIQIAHEQASEILEVTNTWKRDLLLKEAESIVKAKEGHIINVILTPDEGEGVLADFDITIDGKHWFRPVFKPRSWELKQKLPQKLVQSRAVLDAPNSLSSFQELWDDLAEKGTLLLPAIPVKCYVITATTARDCERQPYDPAHNGKPMFFSFGRSEKIDKYASLLQTEQWTYEFWGAENFRDPTVTLPVRNFEETEFDGQKALVGASQKWTEKSGRSFTDAFRELAEVYEPLKNADISSAERILDAEAKRTGDSFETAGLKIPAEIAVRCGVLLVLGVQLYMLIHLHEFGNRLDRDAGFEVAWIGVYFSRLARVMLLVSLLVLPACTVVLLSIRGLSLTQNKQLAWAALIASNAASIVLSYYIFKVLPQPPAPAPSSKSDAVLSTAVQSKSISTPERTVE